MLLSFLDSLWFVRSLGPSSVTNKQKMNVM